MNPTTTAGLSSPLADFPPASTPALLMATAGLITACSGLATAVGGQIVPLVGRWLDARREARLAEEARSKISDNLRLAVDRVIELESAVRKNGECIARNAAFMHGISGDAVEIEDGPELMRRLLELESIVREYDRKVDIHSELVRQLLGKVDAI